MWYLARIALIAVPWENRDDPHAQGTLFRDYHLIDASSFESAFRKAEHILSIKENTSGSSELDGRKISYMKVGVLDVEPVIDELVSGAEIFDESEEKVACSSALALAMTKKRQQARADYERDHGLPAVLRVFHGDEFYTL